MEKQRVYSQRKRQVKEISKEKVKKWGRIRYKQANNIYGVEIKNWIKGALRPGARTGHPILSPAGKTLNVQTARKADEPNVRQTASERRRNSSRRQWPQCWLWHCYIKLQFYRRAMADHDPLECQAINGILSWHVVLWVHCSTHPHLHNSDICADIPIAIRYYRVPTLWLGVRKRIRPVKIEWQGAGVVICLEWAPDCLHMVQLMPLPSTSSLASLKSRLVLSFWQ